MKSRAAEPLGEDVGRDARRHLEDRPSWGPEVEAHPGQAHQLATEDDDEPDHDGARDDGERKQATDATHHRRLRRGAWRWFARVRGEVPPRDGKRDPWDHLPVPATAPEPSSAGRTSARHGSSPASSSTTSSGPPRTVWSGSRRRLREPGLQGWSDLPSEVLAPDVQTAADVALEVARAELAQARPGRHPWRDSGPGRISRG